MTKTQLLNLVIKMTKTTGQGIPYFIKVKSPELGYLLNELVEEGLIIYSKVEYSDSWWTAANCYNVWHDGRGNELAFIRMYLGIDDLGLGVKLIDVLSNLDFMKKYSNWLDKNIIELEKLKNLKEIEEKYEVLTGDVLDYFLEFEYVKDNKSVKDIKDSLNERLELTIKMINIHNQIINLSKNSDKHINSLNKSKNEKEECENEIKFIKKILNFLTDKNENELIKSFL